MTSITNPAPDVATEEAVLLEARDELERYVGRLPSESKWRDAFLRMADNAAASVEAKRMIERLDRGEREAHEDDVLSEAAQTLNVLVGRLPESSAWRNAFDRMAASIEREQRGDEWEVRAELDLAAWIETYLAEQPPPSGLNRMARDLAELAALLRDDARHRGVPA